MVIGTVIGVVADPVSIPIIRAFLCRKYSQYQSRILVLRQALPEVDRWGVAYGRTDSGDTPHSSDKITAGRYRNICRTVAIMIHLNSRNGQRYYVKTGIAVHPVAVGCGHVEHRARIQDPGCSVRLASENISRNHSQVSRVGAALRMQVVDRHRSRRLWSSARKANRNIPQLRCATTEIGNSDRAGTDQ